MLVTLKTKAIDRQTLLQKISHYPSDSCQVSKSIKDFFQGSRHSYGCDREVQMEMQSKNKNISVIQYRKYEGFADRVPYLSINIFEDKNKISLETTSSSISATTKHSHINNPNFYYNHNYNPNNNYNSFTHFHRNTQNQSAQKFRKKIQSICNPQQEQPEKIFNQQIKDLNRKSMLNAYHIKQRSMSAGLKSNKYAHKKLINTATKNTKYSTKLNQKSSSPAPQLYQQTGISKKSRQILCRWLINLSQQLSLPRDVYYNAIHYFDKYLSSYQKQKQNKCKKQRYQTIGLCALFLASKLEVCSHPSIDVFVEAMQGTISKEDIVRIEQNMVIRLQWRLNPPTLCQYMVLIVSLFNNFITRYNDCLQISQKITNYFAPLRTNSQIYNQLYQLLDTIFIQNTYKKFNNKQKVCLSILYITLKLSKVTKEYPLNINLSSNQFKKKYPVILTQQSFNSPPNNLFDKLFQLFLVTSIQIYRKLDQLRENISFCWAVILETAQN